MALQFYLWSRTAAANATADPAVNYQEGQAPSSLNDSGRAVMASAAAFRDDISGAIVTGGSATAYTVTSYQIFDTLAHMNGAMIAFTPHATSTNTVGNDVTLNVDGLGAKSIRPAPSIALPGGSLILGTPYVATYNNSDSAWYLQGGAANAYSIPLGGGLTFWGATAPNSTFAFPAGQAISRTTYAALFSVTGTSFGSGDGSTTFNLPDVTGRVLAMKEASATRLTSTYFVGDSTVLGATGGLESAPLSLAQLPTGITSANTGSIALSVLSTINVDIGSGNFTAIANAGNCAGVNGQNQVTSVGTIAIGAVPVTSNNTSGSSHKNVQPTMICNYIMRVI